LAVKILELWCTARSLFQLKFQKKMYHFNSVM